MTSPPSQAIREAIRDLAPIGTALVDAAARLAYMRELMPPRGDLSEEFRELVVTLAWLERVYRDADEKLVQAYALTEHHERVPNPLPLNGHP